MTTYTIRELSAMFHIPASTLRYYEERGLLTNIAHTDTRQRIYTEEHVNRLRAIQCFKQTGLPLGKMQLFFEYEKDIPAHIDDIIELMNAQEETLLSEVQQLQQGLSHIRRKIRFYSGIREAIQENAPWPQWEDWEE